MGLILPRFSFQDIGASAAMSTFIGSVIYFIIYNAIRLRHISYNISDIFYDILSNNITSIFGGFIGGVIGSVVKKNVLLPN